MNRLSDRTILPGKIIKLVYIGWYLAVPESKSTNY